MPAFGAFGTTPTITNTAKTHLFPDNWNPIEVQGAPDDTITSLNFSPKVNNGMAFFCASSWANDIRLWEMNTNTGACTPKAQQNHNMPVLDTCWSTDGTKIYTACADKTANCWDIGANTFTQVAAHDEPISTINIINVNGNDVLMTGSWDKKLRFWDCKNPKPIAELDIGFKVYAADACYPVAVAIGSDKKTAVVSFETGSPTLRQKDWSNTEWPAKLSHQYTCVTLFKNRASNYMPDGYAVGSTEARVSITYFNPAERKKVDPKAQSSASFSDPNFAFKCHRTDPPECQVNGQAANGAQHSAEAYSIGFVKFHPEFQTLITAGSDGKYVFWDKDNRTKLGPNFPKTSANQKYQYKLPMSCGDISPDGKFFVFAVGYDWSYGHEYSNMQANKPQIFIHPEAVNQEGSTIGTLRPKPK